MPPRYQTKGGGAMKTLWTVLGAVGFLSGAAFFVFLILFWTKLLPADETVISGGTMALVVGLFSLREAFSTTAERGKWRHSEVPCGRLSSFAFGLGFCAVGVATLSYRWLIDQIVPGLVFFGTFIASFVLGLVGQQLDARRYEASRTAIRRRGWLRASRRADDALPTDEVHRRQQARANLRQSIQRHLTGRTTWERAEEQYRYLADPARDLAAPTDWPEVADEWRAFRSAAMESDELWRFNTISARRGRDCGEEGFALLRDGTVVDWFITAVVA
jgi:hypothetical protein